VRPYQDTERQRVQLSTDGGGAPAWSSTGDALFFRQPTGQLTRVAVGGDGASPFGLPEVIAPPRYSSTAFGNGPRSGRRYDVLPDGRFLMAKEGGGRIVVVQNWLTELEQLVPTN
jgi:hypothetical protein